MDLKHYEIEDGKGYFSVNETYLTISNKNDFDAISGYIEILIVEMYWDNSAGEESACHAERDIYVKGYGFNGKVYDSEEEIEEHEYELTREDTSERNIWDFETLEEAEKFAFKCIEERAKQYCFD